MSAAVAVTNQAYLLDPAVITKSILLEVNYCMLHNVILYVTACLTHSSSDAAVTREVS
jgi:hypothetical protein